MMSDMSEQKCAQDVDAQGAAAENSGAADKAEGAQAAEAAAAAAATDAAETERREGDASSERAESAQAATAEKVDGAADGAAAENSGAADKAEGASSSSEASVQREGGTENASAGETSGAFESASSDAHTRNVSEMFGRMTPWYDLQNRVFSLFLDCWWRHNLVNAVVPGPTGLVIDMASGTLDVALAVIRRYPELRVCATDICEPMLRYGEEHKIRAGERSRITTMVADARHMPLPDGCADAVTMAFGIRNVRPRMEALREMHRLLVPGGRACILEFAPVSAPLFGPAYHWYLRRIMPKLAGLVSRSTSAYDYFAETIENFPKPAAFSEELREAGFAFVQHIPFTLGVANLHIAVRS